MMSEQKRDTTEEESPKKFPLKVIRGLLFPEPFFRTDVLENALDLKPQDTDIFVVTYPKCGTTWAQYIVWEIIHSGAVPPSPNQMMFQHFPFLEVTEMDIVDKLPRPRTMKTHLPFSLQPYSPKAKYIYILRNPWDCCVSYFYHHKNDPIMPKMNFDDYFECFITGDIGWGDYFDHVLSWFEHRNDPNVLFLTYEDMKKDKKKTLLSVAKFLGDTFYKNVKKEEVMQNCLKHTDFKYMKELGMFFPQETSHADLNAAEIKSILEKIGEVDRNTANAKGFKEVNFFRKGEVGDWKNHFSAAHVKKFNEYMIRKLKNTEMEKFWQPLLEETTL